MMETFDFKPALQNLLLKHKVARKQYTDVFFVNHKNYIYRINLLKCEVSKWTPKIEDLCADDWHLY